MKFPVPILLLVLISCNLQAFDFRRVEDLFSLSASYENSRGNNFLSIGIGLSDNIANLKELKYNDRRELSSFSKVDGCIRLPYIYFNNSLSTARNVSSVGYCLIDLDVTGTHIGFDRSFGFKIMEREDNINFRKITYAEGSFGLLRSFPINFNKEIDFKLGLRAGIGSIAPSYSMFPEIRHSMASSASANLTPEIAGNINFNPVSLDFDYVHNIHFLYKEGKKLYCRQASVGLNFYKMQFFEMGQYYNKHFRGIKDWEIQIRMIYSKFSYDQLDTESMSFQIGFKYYYTIIKNFVME